MLDYILRHLGYTHCDELTRSRIADLVEQGKAYLSQYDPDIDWRTPSPFCMGMLKDYCLYAISNASDDFKTNYGAELMTLHHLFLARTLKEVENADDVQAK